MANEERLDRVSEGICRDEVVPPEQQTLYAGQFGVLAGREMVRERNYELLGVIDGRNR
jgi:hypothetical protein